MLPTIHVEYQVHEKFSISQLSFFFVFLRISYGVCFLSYFPVDLKDKKERTALTFAAELGHPEVTSWLLKAEADVSRFLPRGICNGWRRVA